MVEPAMRGIKYCLFGFNFIFFLCGIVLVAIGAYVQLQLREYLNFVDSENISGPAILIVIIGSAAFVVAFFGCCGAIKENYCMLLTFSVLLGVVFIFEICCGIAGFVLKDRVQTIAVSNPKFDQECCDHFQFNCTGTSATECIRSVDNLLRQNVYMIGAVAMALAVIQVAGIVLSCCLSRAVKREFHQN